VHASEGSDHAGHAFLHDFCMTIPFGAIALVSAGALTALGAAQTAVPVALCGLAVVIASVLSLKSWRINEQSFPYTLISAGASQ
jgi:hypothetical protein